MFNCNNTIKISLIILIFCLILWIIFNLRINSKDNFTFKLSPGKQCCNSYLADPKECSFFYNTKEGRDILNKVCCKNGYNGQNV